LTDIDQLEFIGRELQRSECLLAAADGSAHLNRAAGRRLKNTSSMAFGGPDLKTVYLGCLSGHSLATLRSAIAELLPYHWTFTARESVRA